MKKLAGTWLLSFAMLSWIAAPVQARAKKKTDIRIDEKQVGVVKVDPPRPHVTYVLARTRLDHSRKEKSGKLAPKILDAIRGKPF